MSGRHHATLGHHFSERAKLLKASEIRELLKLTQIPGMISFAGGVPNPEAFPIAIVEQLTVDILRRQGVAALQYGTTEGFPPLREQLAKRMRGQGIEDVSADQILVTSGSQQALDLISKVFIDPDDTVVCSAPEYLGALSAFQGYQARLETIPQTDRGLAPDTLEDRLKKLARRHRNPEFVYTIPNFHNPAGITLTEAVRKKLVDLASAYDFLLVEDDPYADLRYAGEHVPPMKRFDEEGRVLYLGTFSKILSPGIRVGWIHASKELLTRLIIAKQATDLCTNSFGQVLAHEYFARGLFPPHLERIKALYNRKRELMLAAMDEYFPQGVEWTKPEGGMFLWATLPEEVDAREMLRRAISKKVAYVSGTAFYANGGGRHAMRLSFTHPPDEDIPEGVRRLGRVINQELVAAWDKTAAQEAQRKAETILDTTLMGRSL